MQRLRAVTKDLLSRVEDRTGRPVQSLRDDTLSVLATLQMARNGAAFHVLRYRPSDDPIDYLVAHQAGFILRLFDNDPDKRFDFAPAPDAGTRVEPLLSAGTPLGPDDRRALPDFARFVAQWALMNLRSIPVGMRIDRWIADELPDLRDLQAASLATQQQDNANLLALRHGRLTVPTPLMGTIAAYALFADRLCAETGGGSWAVPFGAAGLDTQGRALLDLWDRVPGDARHDRELVDRWAHAEGLAGWYRWVPYRP